MSIEVIGVGTCKTEKCNMQQENCQEDMNMRRRGEASVVDMGIGREEVNLNRRGRKSSNLKDLELLQCDLFRL